MGQILSLLDALHATNVTRVAKQILKTFGTTALSTEIAERMSPTLPGLNNWFTIKFIINRHFPPPSLCHLTNPDYVEVVVIKELLKPRRPPAVRHHQEQDCNQSDG